MSQELMSLAISALDSFNVISKLQELIEISIEQLDQPTDKAHLRLELLLECYQTSMMSEIDELKVNLEDIQNHAKELIKEASQVPDVSNPFKV